MRVHMPVFMLAYMLALMPGPNALPLYSRVQQASVYSVKEVAINEVIMWPILHLVSVFHVAVAGSEYHLKLWGCSSNDPTKITYKNQHFVLNATSHTINFPKTGGAYSTPNPIPKPNPKPLTNPNPN